MDATSTAGAVLIAPIKVVLERMAAPKWAGFAGKALQSALG